MKPSTFRALGILGVLLTLLALVQSCSASVSQAEAKNAISQAEEAVKTAYSTIADADKAGANVSQLASFFNVVLENLTEAKRMMDRGQFQEAASLATAVVNNSMILSTRASGLRVTAEDLHSYDFRNRLILSFGLALLISLSGFLGWKRLKRRYMLELMNRKPEVLADES